MPKRLIFWLLSLVVVALVIPERARADDTAESESDSSAGAVVRSLAFQLERARGAVQPSLSLRYSSRDKALHAGGIGWSLNLAAIEIRNLDGPPRFRFDVPAPGAATPSLNDHYVYGSEPLVFLGVVPADNRGLPLQDGEIAAAMLPPAQRGWRVFKLRNDSLHALFFLSPDARSWRVSLPSGETLVFGIPVEGPPEPEGIDVDAATGAAFRWNLTRRFDVHGTRNLIAYRWRRFSQVAVLTDIFDTPPTSGTADFSAYLHHTHLRYRSAAMPPSADGRVSSPHVIEAVDVTAKVVTQPSVFDPPSFGERAIVRRYFLDYVADGDAGLHLHSVTLEGSSPGAVESRNGEVTASTRAPRMPSTSFSYAMQTAGAPWLLREIDNGRGEKTAFSYAADRSSPAALDVLAREVHSVTGGETEEIHFAYDRAMYDEQRLLGFRSVTATRTTDGAAKRVTKTTFVAAPNDSQLDDRLRAVVGSPLLIEVMDDAAHRLKTLHMQYRLSASGRKGGESSFGSYVSAIDTWLFAASQVAHAVSNMTMPSADAANGWTLSAAVDVGGAGSVHLRTVRAEDAFGNEVMRRDEGRGARLDDGVVTLRETETLSALRGAWGVRIKSVSRGGRKIDLQNDSVTGEPTDFSSLLSNTELSAFEAKRTSRPPDAIGDGARVHHAGAIYDAWGNQTRAVQGGDASCVSTLFDQKYAFFAFETRTSPLGCEAASSESAWRTRRRFQSVRAEPVEVLLPNDTLTRVDIDAFGRVTSEYLPDPEMALAASREPSTQVAYDDSKTSRIRTTEALRTKWTVLDGRGRIRCRLAEGDPAHGERGWLVSESVVRGASGIFRAYAPFFSDTDPRSDSACTPPSGAAFVETRYDAFGRATEVRELDGTRAQATTFHALSVDKTDARRDAKGLGPLSIALDGHGRVSRVTDPTEAEGKRDTAFTDNRYALTGELLSVTKWHQNGAEKTIRTMAYNSLGRLVRNDEPNAGTWRYAYDRHGWLVGTADARGCGKDIAHDKHGRALWEDYRPCEAHHEAYSPPSANGDGTEVLYLYDAPEAGEVEAFGETDERRYIGRVAAIYDRGAHTQFSYDGRGRPIGTRRRAAKPETSAKLSERYAGHFFEQTSAFDALDRLVTQSTGADDPDFFEAGKSAVSVHYSMRGDIDQVGSSYGALIESIEADAFGAVTSVRYGTAAHHTLTMAYDARHRLKTRELVGITPRAPRPITGEPAVLAWNEFHYDAAGDLIALDDRRDANEWPRGAKPASKAMRYDGAGRLTRVDSASRGDTLVLPAVHSMGPFATPPLRMKSQTFGYSWLGDMTSSDDDAHAFWQRSSGQLTYEDTAPNRLVYAHGESASAMLSSDAAGSTTAITLSTDADTVWNLPRGIFQTPIQTVSYKWDEVGRLASATKWGAISTSLTADLPEVTIRYAYDSSGERVRKSVALKGEAEAHTLDLFPSLRITEAPFNAAVSDYERISHEQLRLAGVARVVPNESTANRLKTSIFFDFTDHLGSTESVVAKRTGELVERITYAAYGQSESHWQSPKWKSEKAPWRFTGKEDEEEVGLIYFGARYYVPALGRWLSADPLTIHAMAGDANPYAYVAGQVFSATDPTGLRGTVCGQPPPWAIASSGGGTSTGFPTEGPDLSGPDGPASGPVRTEFIGYSREWSLDPQTGNGGWEDVPVYRAVIEPGWMDRAAEAFGQAWHTATTRDPNFMGGTVFAGPIGLIAEGAVLLEEVVVGAEAVAQEAAILRELGYKTNSVAHIFQEKHMLQPLVTEMGSVGAALRELHTAAQGIARSSATYQTGSWVAVRVGDMAVSIKGAIVDGVFRVSTATMRPF